tara:strand:- start:60 stop:344 length:285 start_codon:yes stop_codon:yes gene_type:complete
MMPRFHNINGERVQFTAAEETARDEEEQAWADGANDRAAVQVRDERDAKLAASDWMANSDVTMSAAWKTYRQALRDVPAQAGFPTNVTWPTEPS